MSEKTTGQTQAQQIQKEFNPTELIKAVTTWDSEEMAKHLDQAMYYLVLYTMNEGVADSRHADTYFHLRTLRDAILIGSNNVDLN